MSVVTLEVRVQELAGVISSQAVLDPNCDDLPSASIEPVFIPDLLHPTPTSRLDVEHTRLALAFAFASGVSGGLFGEALERATTTASTWEPPSFANDLFLQDFVARCLQVRLSGKEATPVNTGHLAKLLAHPPSDAAAVHHRRAIASELAESVALRSELER